MVSVVCGSGIVVVACGGGGYTRTTAEDCKKMVVFVKGCLAVGGVYCEWDISLSVSAVSPCPVGRVDHRLFLILNKEEYSNMYCCCFVLYLMCIIVLLFNCTVLGIGDRVVLLPLVDHLVPFASDFIEDPFCEVCLFWSVWSSAYRILHSHCTKFPA